MINKLWNMFLSTPPHVLAIVCIIGLMAEGLGFGNLIQVAIVVGVWHHGRTNKETAQ